MAGFPIKKGFAVKPAAAAVQAAGGGASSAQIQITNGVASVPPVAGFTPTSYLWHVGGTEVGQSASYALATGDYGKPISCTLAGVWAATATIPSLQAAAISLLQSVNGSLWIVHPDNTFVMENGTVAPTAGSAIGYLKDLVGTRHMTQATTAAKPLIDFVPTRLGPELVVNGDFSNGIARWVTWDGATIANNAGVGGITFGASSSSRVGIPFPTEVGKKYQLNAQVFEVTAGAAIRSQQESSPWALMSSSPMSVGNVSHTFVASQTTSIITILKSPSATAGQTCAIDNISVREVLEEGWALRFNGLNGFMATGPLPSVSAETMIVAGQFTRPDATQQGMIWKRNGNNGLFIRRNGGGGVDGAVMTGATFGGATLQSSTSTTPSVYSLRASNSACAGRVNGAQVWANTQAFVSANSALLVGAEAGSTFPAQCNVFATAYAPVALTDDQCKLIETLLGQLSGVPIV